MTAGNIVPVDEEIAEAHSLSSADRMRSDRAVKVNPHVNFVEFHHPDGTTSVIAVPLKEPYRSTRIRYYLNKRNPETGERWFFAQRQKPAPEMKYRCFVETGMGQCQKRLLTLADLLNHAEAKHPQECLRYGDLIVAIRRRLQLNIDPMLMQELGLAPQAATPVADPQPVDAAMLEVSDRADCDVCGWKNVKGTPQGLMIHKNKWCKGAADGSESGIEEGRDEGAEPADAGGAGIAVQ